MITAEQLAQWREVCEKATPGPWLDSETGDVYARTPKGGRLIADFVPHEEDRRFIVAASVGFPALLDEVERLRALLRDWDAACKGHCDTEAIAARVAEALR